MTDIHDIRPPVSVVEAVPWVWIAAIAALAVAMALLAGWIWRRRKGKDVSGETVAPLPPEENARRLLADLTEEGFADAKMFYYRLSAILRDYVHGRFGIGAPEMTTEELMPKIDGLPLAPALSARLKALCQGSDPVKYGGEPATPERMSDDLAFARTFVEETVPQTATDEFAP